MSDERDRRIPDTKTFVVFVIGYFVAVRLGEHTYGSAAVPSPFWLPDSVFLCALLLTPPSQWWAYAVAIWPTRFLAGVVPGTPMWFQLASAGNDTIKGLAAAWLLQRFARKPIRLTTVHELLLYLGIAAGALPALSASAAAPARYVLGDPLWRSWYQWFLGDALTQVVVTPTLLYWCTHGFTRPRRIAESIVICGGLAVVLFLGLTVDRLSSSLIFIYMPVPFLIWAAVRLGPFGTANALTLMGVVSMMAAVGGGGVFAGVSPERAVLSIQLFLLVLATSLLSLAILVVEREDLLDREAALSTQLIGAQDHERSRIASELHDDIGQQLAVLVIGIEQLRRQTGLPDDGRRQLDVLSHAAAQMSSDIQGLSHRLHPVTLDLMGVESAVRSLCHQLAEHQGLQVQVRWRGVPIDLSRDLSLCCYRIVQEALHNVVKHSGVRNAAIDVDADAERLTVSISDEGRGFDPSGTNVRAGLGLLSMRERVRALGGDLAIDARPHKGTRLRAVLPLARIPARG